MATSFDRWAKDPFFAAAEEVQESADRMESVYRLWVQERRADSPSAALRRDLHTVLGTAKWQLEVLERAVNSNDKAWSAGEDTITRHRQFMTAIADKISMVEKSLRESNLEEGELALSWVRLDEGERDELAHFLSCPLTDRGNAAVTGLSGGNGENGEASASCSKNSYPSTTESSSWEMREERFHGHRRVASASTAAEIGELKISVLSEKTPLNPLDQQPNIPPRRILSFSGLTSAMHSASKMKWYRNGFRKWKSGYQHDTVESLPLRNHPLRLDIDAFYERGKNCLSSCDEFDAKQIDGWAGALHRQLQRSQYHIQYGRSFQMIVWSVLAVLMIVILLLCMG